MSEPVVFVAGMEGLIKALEPRVDAAFWKKLRERGFDREKPLLAATPAKTWLLVLEAGVEAVGGDRTAALRALGVAAIEGFQQTLVGRALFPLLKLIGLKRGLERISRSFQSGNDFLDMKLVSFEPGEARLEAREVLGVGEHFAGMLIAGCTAVGAREVSCETRPAGNGAHFVVKWSR